MQDTQDIDIEALKKDPEFLDNMKELEAEMHSEQSIAKGYNLLDAKLAIGDDEDAINDVFTFIVNTAFDKLSERLTQYRGFDLTSVEDFATARAIYEHAIQRYSENDKKGAKEMFLVLHHTLSDDELKEAMMIHACAVMAGHTFEEFIENLSDTENMDPNDPRSVFVTTFTQPNDILLNMFVKYVKQGEEELKVLEKKD